MTSPSCEITYCTSDNPSESDVVILFHGMTGTPSEMAELAEALHAEGYDCFIPRLSGHGSTLEALRATPLSSWLRDVESMFQETSEYRRVFVVGQSFGALLALYGAIRYPSRVSAVAVLSLPWVFRSFTESMLLRILSYMPDSVLNRLGFKRKRHRDGVVFRQKRHAYAYHSIAAAARVFALKRLIESKISQLRAPTLLLHDPLDHHLRSSSVFAFRVVAPPELTTDSRWLYGGYHELTLGPCFPRVVTEISNFFKEV